MKRITKNIWRTVICVVVLSFLALATLGWLYVRKAPQLLGQTLSQRLRTTVTVDEVSFSWDGITIRGVTIANIRESILPQAFKAETIEIKTPLLNLLKDNVEIESITIDGIYLGLEFDTIKSPKGNWTRLVENLYTQIDTQTKVEAARTVSIERLDLNNITTQLVYKTKPHKVRTLRHIDHIPLRNISSHGGFPIDQILNSVLGQMLMEVFRRENLNNMLKDLLNPKNTLKNILSPFKMLIP